MRAVVHKGTETIEAAIGWKCLATTPSLSKRNVVSSRIFSQCCASVVGGAVEGPDLYASASVERRLRQST